MSLPATRPVRRDLLYASAVLATFSGVVFACGISVSLIFAQSPARTVSQPAFAHFEAVKPVLRALVAGLPPDLKSADAARWNNWSRRQDQVIRARLDQGDLDSAVNLLLFGTSFTSQPRIRIEDMVEASRSGVLRLRVLDLLQGLRNPGDNERLVFLRNFFRGKGMDPDTAEGSHKIGVFVLENVQRALKELRKFADRAENSKQPGDAGAEFNERSRLFRDRGVSLDTSILPNFAIEETLRDVMSRGLLREKEISRMAVIGPGLDFADWDAGYDYYPQQTLQPFALYESLVRLKLAKARPRVTVFDISPRVIQHLQRAAKKDGYTVQLPRDASRQWLPATVNYWRGFGDQIGMGTAPIEPPEMLRGLETRAVRIRSAVVKQCEPVDLNIVLQRLELPAAERFDLIIATNVFVYYDRFEQALAMGNVAAMLRPGGLLLVNNRLPELPGGGMRQVGSTSVRYASEPTAQDSVLWYRRE